jgi:phytoene synthase
MTSPPDRNALVAAAREAIEQGSKSFRLASRLFDRETRERAWLLYAWCRACDDLTDGQTLGHGQAAPADPQQRLALLSSLTERALAGERTGEAAFDALALVVAECAVPHALVRDHLAGFAMDAAGWRPADEADLLLYCYRVAGAVGCMMAVVMSIPAHEQDTLDRASDLGIAFQLANIARDIADDCRNGRCYVPAQWLAEAGIAPGEQTQERHAETMASLAARLASLARAYEASARTGAARLPFRSRWAVLSAAGIYGAIGRKVAERGALALNQRVVIRKRRKLAEVGRALALAGAGAREADRDGLWTRPR